MSRFMETVRDRVVFYDGSMGATILNMQLTAEEYGGKEGCNDYLSIVNPSIVEDIHASFLEAGADVLRNQHLRRQPAEARGIRDRRVDVRAQPQGRRACPPRCGFVQHGRSSHASWPARSGRPGLLPASEDPMLGNHRFPEVVDLFLDQIRGLVDGGSDVLIIETVQDILELKAAIHAAEQVFAEREKRIPIQASITLDTPGAMLLGTDIAAALTVLEALAGRHRRPELPTGPEHMREPARYLGEYSTRPVSIIPNAGHSDQCQRARPVSRWSRSRWRASSRDGRGVRRRHRRRLLRHDSRAITANRRSEFRAARRSPARSGRRRRSRR